jgi:protein SCO1
MKTSWLNCLILLSITFAKPMLAAKITDSAWPNTPVINQRHQALNFNELIKNKTVAINFIFTTCTSSCPLATAVFKQVQTQLGAQNIHLISISVDPDADTPEKLSAFAQQFQIESRWDFITGKRADITALLKALEVYSPDKTLHTNRVLIGNDKTHTWTRLYGLPSADDIVNAVKQLSNQQGNVHAARH